MASAQCTQPKPNPVNPSQAPAKDPRPHSSVKPMEKKYKLSQNFVASFTISLKKTQSS